MIVFIALLLFAEGVRIDVSCHPTALNADANFDDNAQIGHQREDNWILDELPSRGARPSSLRSIRDLEFSNPEPTTEPRIAFERAINQTVSDYYAQRKAVMDRYYARQREIVEKFSRAKSQPRGTVSDTTRSSFFDDGKASTTRASTDTGTVTNYDDNEHSQKYKSYEGEANQPESRNSSVSWIYRSSNWNPKLPDNSSDIDLQPKSSNTLERSVDSTQKLDGYYKLGEFRGSKDEKIVYQHNLGVGLKGSSSQLNATFEVVLEGSFAITVIEAFPYANTRANVSWINGGPGTDYVKLRLNGYENEGFSYTVKVWGVPKEI